MMKNDAKTPQTDKHDSQHGGSKHDEKEINAPKKKAAPEKPDHSNPSKKGDTHSKDKHDQASKK